MKKRCFTYYLFVLLIISLLPNTSLAQLLHESNQVGWEVQATRVYWGTQGDAVGTNTPRFQLRAAESTDGNASHVNSGGIYVGGTRGNWTSSNDNTNMGTIARRTDVQPEYFDATTLNWHVDTDFTSWEDDGCTGGNINRFDSSNELFHPCSGDFSDGSFSRVTGNTSFTSDIPLNKNWYSVIQKNLGNGSAVRYRTAWRYRFGDGQNTPLDFGTMLSQTKTHRNSNAPPPAGAHSTMGYSDSWTGGSYGSSPDVMYKFYISTARTVTISTDHGFTDFDTFIHIGSYEDDTFSRIGGRANGSSGGVKAEMTIDLCAGNYAVIIEGSGSDRTGLFWLEITDRNIAVNGGTLAFNAPRTFAANTNLSNYQINSATNGDATSTDSNAEIQWQRRSKTSSGSWLDNWTTVTDSDGNAQTYTLPSDGLPAISGQNTNYQFRRRIRVNCTGSNWVASSNVIDLTVIPFATTNTFTNGGCQFQLLTNARFANRPCGTPEIFGATTISASQRTAMLSDPSKFIILPANNTFTFYINQGNGCSGVTRGRYYYGSPSNGSRTLSFPSSEFNNIGNKATCSGAICLNVYPAVENFQTNYADVLTIQLMNSSNEVVYEIGFPLLVEGDNTYIKNGVPQINADGSMLTPQIPWMILHDPPGDASFATYETTTETCRSYGINFSAGVQNEVGGSVKLGVEGQTGVSLGVSATTSYKAYAQMSGSIEAGLKGGAGSSTDLCFKSTTTFSTGEDNSEIDGAKGDVFLGTGMEYTYGTLRTVSFDRDNCEVDFTADFSLFAGQSTDFAWTEAKIIEDVERLEGVIAGITEDTEEKAKAEAQKQVWEKVLNINAAIKSGSSTAIGYKSYNGGVAETDSKETSFSQMETIEFEAFLNGEITREVGAEVGGSGGSVYHKVRLESSFGGNTVTGSTTTKTISYSISDGEGDKINVDIYEDPVFGTPYFKLRESSETSCPYEGGIKKDQPKVRGLINGVEQQNVVIHAVPGSTVTFPLNICNESNFDREYELSMAGGTNLNNAIIIVGGKNINDETIDYPPNVESGVTNFNWGGNSCFDIQGNKPIFSLRQDPDDTNPPYAYENVILNLISPCDADQISSVSVSVYFDDLDGDGFADDTDNDGVIDVLDACPQTPQAGLDFDGVDDIIISPEKVDHNVYPITTWEAWVYPTSNEVRWQTIFTTTGNFSGRGLYMYGDQFAVGCGDNNYYAGAANLNQWQHVALVYDNLAGTAKLYRDGALVFDYFTQFSVPPGADLNIGKMNAFINTGFTGKIDEVRIWDNPRTVQELLNNADTELDPTLNGTVVYYPMNEGQPAANNTAISSITDYSGRNVHATPTGFAKTGTSSNWNLGAPVNHAANGNCATNSLPLNLLSFEGETLSKINLLTWQVSEEINTLAHHIERSTDGTDFTEIGKVAANQSSQNSRYEFTDTSPLQRAYYRLRIQNTDGSEQFSNIILLERKTAAAFAITNLYPNPAQSEFFIDYEVATSTDLQVRIIDLTGKTILQQTTTGQVGRNQIALDVNLLPVGSYFVQLQRADGEVITKKLMIQK
ncbi:MAG: LamG-like jellyroll fold domain-containing protein [Saprospiraceae bacterium]